jgi:hypothetical protein
MHDLERSPEDWLSSRRVPRLPRERMGLRRPLADASFEWIDVAGELLGKQHAFPERAERAAATAFAAQVLTLGPYTIEQIGPRVELRVGSAVRWAADAAAFGGVPQVTLQGEPGSATITVSDAFYPGTTIPADLELQIFQENGAWQARLRLKLGAFDARLPLQPWLDRSASAVSLVALDLSCCPLGPASELRADGAAVAAFSADWVLALFGVNILALAGFQDNVTADVALIVPLPAGGPPFMLPQTLRRTAILFASDTQFPLVPEISQPWPRFHRGGFRFDSLALEAGLDGAGSATRLLFAQSANDPERLGLEPAVDLRGSDDETFRLLVQDPRYAMLFDDARTQRVAALLAHVDETPRWMHGPGCSVALTRSNTQPNLVVADLAGGSPLVACNALGTKVAFHVPEMLVRPAPAPPRLELVFSWGPLATPLPPRAGQLEVDLAVGTSVLRLPRDLTLDLVRRDDFLVLGYTFDNLRYEGAGASRRFLRDAATDAPFLIVRLPPQSVGEEAFFEEAKGFPPGQTKAPKAPPPPKAPDAPPVKALLAQPSRLVFGVPVAVSSLDLSAPRLLTWTDLTPSLAPTALPGQVILVRPNRPDLVLIEHPLVSALAAVGRTRARRRTRPAVRAVPTIVRAVNRNVRPLDRLRIPPEILLEPAPPTPRTTAIEAPFRLIISPNKYGGWKHSLAPVAQDGRFELWHTRLGIRSGKDVDEEQTLHRSVRAIWARDFTITIPEGRPFLMSLSQDDRRILVRLTSDFTISPPPIPVGVNRLMLTALGAWMDTEVKFDPPAQLPIEEWQHRATLGRDHFVKVVYPGHVYGLGNRASVVKITERKVQPTPLGDPAAYLRQQIRVIIKEPERIYTGPGYANGGREFPFKRVRILTKITPPLDPPQDHPLGTLFAPAPLAKFWPHVLGQPFLFHVKTWDWEDREADHNIPLAFVRTDMTADDQGKPDEGKLGTVIAEYNAPSTAVLRAAKLGGQGVSYAETDAASVGKTRFETDEIRLKGLPPTPGRKTAKETPVYPQLERATVSIPSLRQVVGSAGTAVITLEPYITLGFGGGNPAKLFAHVEGAALDYAGKADRAGGVVTPNLQVRGLARELGAVGDDGTNMRTGKFEPADFFAGAAPKLLGGISLLDIIESATGTDFLQKTPKLVTENRDDFIRTQVDWATDKLKDAANGFRASLSAAGPASTLTLSSLLLTRKDTGATDFTLSGALTNFRLSLFNVIEVAFKVFSFKSENGKKPDFHVELDGTGFKFLGDLEFVNEVVKVLDTGHFTDPPFLDISPQGLALGYTLTIPTVAVGVVGLSNIALGARLSLPFTGDPARLRFNLSERQNPFIVSVAPFGGGGFFAIAVGVDGLEVLEASVEFGGNVSIDLGVASGGVYVMAGIYFRIKVSPPASSELTGYIRLGGSLSVLGIITVSIEFYLGLSYGDGKAWGEARVTVSIDVFVFHGDVTVRCRRELAGSAGDPPFRELMPHERWQAYAAAFA